jgi:hypothetical protein
VIRLPVVRIQGHTHTCVGPYRCGVCATPAYRAARRAQRCAGARGARERRTGPSGSAPVTARPTFHKKAASARALAWEVASGALFSVPEHGLGRQPRDAFSRMEHPARAGWLSFRRGRETAGALWEVDLANDRCGSFSTESAGFPAGALPLRPESDPVTARQRNDDQQLRDFRVRSVAGCRNLRSQSTLVNKLIELLIGL